MTNADEADREINTTLDRVSKKAYWAMKDEVMPYRYKISAKEMEPPSQEIAAGVPVANGVEPAINNTDAYTSLRALPTSMGEVITEHRSWVQANIS